MAAFSPKLAKPAALRRKLKDLDARLNDALSRRHRHSKDMGDVVRETFLRMRKPHDKPTIETHRPQ